MNRFRNMTLILVLILATLGVFFGIRQIEYRLDNTINENKLRFTGEVTDAPPAVVFTTVALGSFRGLLADILWLRSETLKSKKNYFEMVQLAQWITDLQPNYSAGTAYLAWNLAYNISVTSSSKEDRWYWVNEGVKLIRDKAMTYNPDDPMIYRELAWIYLHKMGNLMDDANLYYKNQMAIEMTCLLGEVAPDGRVFIPDWEVLAKAPATKEELLKLYPEDHPLWKKIADAGFKDYDALFNAFRAGKATGDDKVEIIAGLPDSLRLTLTADEFATLDSYFRAQLLRTRLKLDPRKMVELDRKYGKMDWRVPESQAIYWATIGLEESMADGKQPDINCLRHISHGLQSAFRSGRILEFDMKGRYIQMIPNFNLVDSAYEWFEYGEDEFSGSGAGSSFRSGKINFLKDAIPLIYINVNPTKAQQLFEELQRVDGPQKQNNLSDFVLANLTEDIRDADLKKASGVISGLIFRALIDQLSGNEKEAASYSDMAQQLHIFYSRENKDIERNTLPPFPVMVRGVLQNLLNNMPENDRKKLEAIIDAQRAEFEAEQRLRQETTAM